VELTSATLRLQVLCIFLVLAMFVEAVFKVRAAVLEIQSRERRPGFHWKEYIPDKWFAMGVMVDVITTVIMCNFIINQIPSRIGSVERTQAIVEGITSIDWAAEDQSLLGKKTSFFEQIQKAPPLPAPPKPRFKTYDTDHEHYDHFAFPQ
jgi:hypothetical protein